MLRLNYYYDSMLRVKARVAPGSEAKIEVIKKTGLGEVRILIKNGAIYRILTIEDEVINKD